MPPRLSARSRYRPTRKPPESIARRSAGTSKSARILSRTPRYTAAVSFDPKYVAHVLAENFRDAKALFLEPLLSIHYAHLVMLT